MSTEFSVFMKGDAAPLLVAAQGILGCTFGPPDPTVGNARHAELLEISLTFQDHHALEDDLGIPFEEYPISLEFAVSASQTEPELRQSLCLSAARLCARLMAQRGQADTMVVRDVQECVERWPKHNG